MFKFDFSSNVQLVSLDLDLSKRNASSKHRFKALTEICIHLLLLLNAISTEWLQ